MTERRMTGAACPIDEKPLDMEKCSPCPFFRGASRKAGEPWRILCNWPVSVEAVRNGFARVAIPDVFIWED